MPRSFSTGQTFGDVAAADLATLVATATELGSTNENGAVVGKELELYDNLNAVSRWAPSEKPELKAAVDQCIAAYDADPTRGLFVQVGDSDLGGESDKGVGFEESFPRIRVVGLADGNGSYGITPTGGLARGLSEALA